MGKIKEAGLFCCVRNPVFLEYIGGKLCEYFVAGVLNTVLMGVSCRSIQMAIHAMCRRQFDPHGPPRSVRVRAVTGPAGCAFEPQSEVVVAGGARAVWL